MPTHTKIATCCYCSARTFLQPTARQGHELACASCGAPIHEMKWLKAPAAAAPQPKAAKPRKQAKPTRHAKPKKYAEWSKPAKPCKRRRKKKSLFSKVLEEAWDIAEDIFD